MLYSEHMEGDESEACSATPALSLWFWLTVVNVMAMAILRMPMLEQKSLRERILEQQRRARKPRQGGQT